MLEGSVDGAISGLVGASGVSAALVVTESNVTESNCCSVSTRHSKRAISTILVPCIRYPIVLLPSSNQ